MKNLLLLLSVLFVAACSSANTCTIRKPGLTSLLIACDSVSFNDSSYYEPTFFRFTKKGYLMHTFRQKDYAFKILESKVYQNDQDSTYKINMFRVFSYCNEKEYRVFITGLKKNEVIQFEHPERTIRFHILSVTKARLPKEDTWWR